MNKNNKHTTVHDEWKRLHKHIRQMVRDRYRQLIDDGTTTGRAVVLCAYEFEVSVNSIYKYLRESKYYEQ